MLVISRKLNQSPSIGDEITVTVTKVKGKTVTLGIVAPSDLKILRQELEQHPAEEKAKAEQAKTC